VEFESGKARLSFPFTVVCSALTIPGFNIVDTRAWFQFMKRLFIDARRIPFFIRDDVRYAHPVCSHHHCSPKLLSFPRDCGMKRGWQSKYPITLFLDRFRGERSDRRKGDLWSDCSELAISIELCVEGIVMLSIFEQRQSEYKSCISQESAKIVPLKSDSR
jgi:hypothetical protein